MKYPWEEDVPAILLTWRKWCEDISFKKTAPGFFYAGVFNWNHICEFCGEKICG